jgi:hypothetical protein
MENENEDDAEFESEAELGDVQETSFDIDA